MYPEGPSAACGCGQGGRWFKIMLVSQDPQLSTQKPDADTHTTSHTDPHIDFNHANTKLSDSHTHTQSHVTIITDTQAFKLTTKVKETNTRESNMRKLVPTHANIQDEVLQTITLCRNDIQTCSWPILPHLPHTIRSRHPSKLPTRSF